VKAEADPAVAAATAVDARLVAVAAVDGAVVVSKTTIAARQDSRANPAGNLLLTLHVE
jgi:hypothetical protein